MEKEKIDELWVLFREFVIACNQANMTNNATEFLAWLEKYKLPTLNQHSPTSTTKQALEAKICPHSPILDVD